MVDLSIMFCMEILEIYFGFQADHDEKKAKAAYEKFLDSVRDGGIRYVETLSHETELFDTAYVREQNENRELKTNGYVWFGDMANVDENVYETVVAAGKAAVDTALELDARFFMLAPTAFPGIETCGHDELIQALIRHFTPIVAYAKKCGIPCVIEDIDDIRIPMSRPEDYRRILDHVPDLYAVFDTGNALYADIEADEYYDLFAERTVLMHLKDQRIAGTDELAVTSPKGRKLTCTVPGEGEVDFASFFKKARQNGYNHPMVIELVSKKGELLRETVVRAKQYIKELWEVSV